ncbi:MAG: NADH-quinone oxidoreductase subunit H [Deltaproteobacteria bacterium]
MSIYIAGIILLIVKLLVVLVALLVIAAYLILVERRLLGFLQIRLGPNRAGPQGILQPLADAIKLLVKEDFMPTGADKYIFLFAPVVVAATAILIFAVIPFGRGWTFHGRPIPAVVVDLNVGLLYVYALSSLAVYGIALGGWASNSLSLVDIVNAQARYPFILFQPVAFVIFFISSVAETKRIPFDIPEAENELIAGYHMEYSGMRFGLYFLGEYVTMVTLGSVVAVFYLGGWRGPYLPPLLWFLIKVGIVAFVIIWIRGTLPRLRYDQLMHLGWKVLIPLALLNIIVTGGAMLALGYKP